MPVGVDETGHADRALAVDDLRARRLNARRHRDDDAVAHVHVAACKIADLVIHREDVGAAHNEFAARGQRRGRPRLRQRLTRQNGSGGECGGRG